MYLEGGSSSSHTRSPDEPTYINIFKPGSYFSSYKRVTSKREREEWSDHVDIEPFRWHDPSSPCACIEHWRRPPILLGYSHQSPPNDVVEDFSSDDTGDDLRSSEEDSDDSSEGSPNWTRPRIERVSKVNRSRVVTRLSSGLKSSNEFMDPSLWSGLHEELQLQVFAKLPFRSLIRLRAVCKSWNSVIYEHDFHELCPRLPKEAPFCIMFDHLVQGYSIFSPASHTWYRLPRSFFTFSAKKACLLASAGGLCLFEVFGSGKRDLFVVNPLNKSERRLPPPADILNMDEFVYVEMVMDKETDSFKIIVVNSIFNPHDDPDIEDDDANVDEDISSVSVHVVVSFVVYSSRTNSWETRMIEVDVKYRDILSTVLYDGNLYCLIRTIDNRYFIHLMGQERGGREGWERSVGDAIELHDFDHMAFLHLFEQRGHLMICGKSRSAPGLGVRIWQFDTQRMKWKEVQRVPKKLRSKFLKLGWRSRVVVHGNYMWVSGMNRELVMANIESRSWCPVPQYSLGCHQDCSWNPSPRRRTSRYRCTLFLFEPRLDLVL